MYRQVEDEDVGCVAHRLVQDDNEDDQEVPYEPDDDDKGEEDGDDDGDDCHQKPQMLRQLLLR